MALGKALDSNYGTQATYWRITQVSFDVVVRSVWFALAGYVSEEARLANKDPIETRSYDFTLPEDISPESMGREQLYDYVKMADASLSDSEDI
jgi:hypothetical protein